MRRQMYSSAWITPNSFNRHRYALKDWRVNVTTTVIPSSYEWEIRLGAFLNTRGYAILLSKRIGGSHWSVVLDFGFLP